MTDDPLADAEATDRALREQISDLVHARARAAGEAGRLAERAQLPGAHRELVELGERYARQAELLASEIDALRASLRATEAELERLRAPDDG